MPLPWIRKKNVLIKDQSAKAGCVQFNTLTVPREMKRNC